MALPEFRSEPLTDLAVETTLAAMVDALTHVKREMGKEFPLVIGPGGQTVAVILSAWSHRFYLGSNTKAMTVWRALFCADLSAHLNHTST